MERINHDELNRLMNTPKAVPGEFRDTKGNPYFCFKNVGNPFAKDAVIRFFMILRLSKKQIVDLHTKELTIGRPLQACQIADMFFLPAAKKVAKNQLDAIREWLTWNLIDGVDHRCPEIDPKVAAKFPAMKRYAHMVRELGGLHYADNRIGAAFKLPDAEDVTTEQKETADVESRFNRRSNDRDGDDLALPAGAEFFTT